MPSAIHPYMDMPLVVKVGTEGRLPADHSSDANQLSLVEPYRSNRDRHGAGITSSGFACTCFRVLCYSVLFVMNWRKYGCVLAQLLPHGLGNLAASKPKQEQCDFRWRQDHGWDNHAPYS